MGTTCGNTRLHSNWTTYHTDFLFTIRRLQEYPEFSHYQVYHKPFIIILESLNTYNRSRFSFIQILYIDFLLHTRLNFLFSFIRFYSYFLLSFFSFNFSFLYNLKNLNSFFYFAIYLISDLLMCHPGNEVVSYRLGFLQKISLFIFVFFFFFFFFFYSYFFKKSNSFFYFIFMFVSNAFIVDSLVNDA